MACSTLRPGKYGVAPRALANSPPRRCVAAVCENGVLGDPTGSISQEGRQSLARAVQDLDEVIDGWGTRGPVTSAGPAVLAGSSSSAIIGTRLPQ